ncbi:MAG: S1 RNA-binding domain-containing protein [Oscillospiraceae bacterium]|nr:S1 RNA-binding domain-containing protein [Oscillospiraceae bacterium]
MKFYPEGTLLKTAENTKYLSSAELFSEAISKNITLEARAVMCDNEHNLIVDLPFGRGIIPRIEGAVGIDDGTTKDIALISRVNKPVCFKPLCIETDSDGVVTAILSRKLAQQECLKEYIRNLKSGEIINAKITHFESFGCFVDIGCGIPSLIPIDAISVSRISHPTDRFTNGQDILAVVKSVDGNKVYLSHKELLGTWEENALKFQAGETVSGIVRSVESYGVFVELAPNLAGLAEPFPNAKVGQSASVYIKAIIPEKMKVKLIIVDVFDENIIPEPVEYYITEGKIDRWEYSTENSKKEIISIF